MFEQNQFQEGDEESVTATAEVRSAELSALLSKKNGDRNIFWMKMVTLMILVVSSAVIGVQYMFLVKFKTEIEGSMVSIKGVKELTS